MKWEEYSVFDGIALAQGIARGEYSREEELETAIEAIELLNLELNAVVMKNYELARRSPLTDSTSPLAGIPFFLKDVNVFA